MEQLMEATVSPAEDTLDLKVLLAVLKAYRNGDFSARMPEELTGLAGKVADTLNEIIDMSGQTITEFERVAYLVGKQGKVGERVELPMMRGSWERLVDSSNAMADDLVSPMNEMIRVISAVSEGNLDQQVPMEIDGLKLRGQFLKSAEIVNTMVARLGSFTSEVTRVAREVGTEGILGGQAEVKGVSGTWKDLTDSVNGMAANLTTQMRNIAYVTTAVARGDLGKTITVEAKGEILELKNTINTMVDQLSSFAAEVTRVAREVGTEGKLGGQAEVAGVSGTWRDLTESVNSMAANLTTQVRNIADVTTAVANGDLSRKITAEAKGEILQLKETVNTMVDQLSTFAAEVTRVAREVGTEGKLGGQAEVREVSGTWRDLTESVNGMAANLTNQVRNIADVTTAVARGDLSRKITVEAKGEIMELKNTINTMVDQLSTFADEVTRVAREVGTEGKLGGQGQVPGVAGTWKDLTDSVNMMASNLTSQVRNIAQVTTAVANGDLTKKITVDARGEIFELKSTINTMVDQLSTFGAEVTRVAREVGTDGKLGGQAEVAGVSGTWKDLTDSVNGMASNLTAQVRNIADVTIAVANGDLSKKITVDVRGEFLQLKETINTMVDQLRSFASEVTRVAREVGIEGKLGGQAYVTGVAGTWKDLTDSVNMMASNLTDQVRNIAQVTTAVANGDLSKKVTVDVKGEILELKSTVNIMVDQLNAFAAEVTRVAREVGTEGKLGGQAEVRGISGTWKDLTDNVNFMAANLTNQVRGIARVVTAVANGDMKKKLTVEAKGEIAELADTINSMTDTLALFSDQVTSVAREVGVEGKLGGQANVPGAAGTWRDLTDNVNELAANLTNQVRAIAEVATAVTKGDLTRSVQVEARGEVAQLKDNVNEMIRNLRETTRQNAEQDWLKTNLAKFTRLLQGQRDLTAVSELVLSELAPLINAQHGGFYMMDESEYDNPKLKLLSSYAYNDHVKHEWRLKEGLIGQCAFEKKRILLTDIPPGYLAISSGLGTASPLNIIVLPIIFENKVKAVVEMASFASYNAIHQSFLDQLSESIGIVLNTIEANMRTEELLKQSQSLAQELQSQQEELRQTNEELELKAGLLEEQKAEVERKNREVEITKLSLEEKAEQLTLTSKYKSEFLSSMSHELRTPLNSLLILSQQLSENAERNLTARQVEFAKTIYGSGKDLLGLINEILDLSKIESGTVTLDFNEVMFASLQDQVERTFRPVADNRHLGFTIDVHPALPLSTWTDEKRLLQIIKNLLSNAFKFTDKGEVKLTIQPTISGWSVDHTGLNSAETVISFVVTDTGIGVPADKQKLIFEAFQQADTGTSRKYGGTGLGLSISRELARLLGGELRLISSELEKGSVFALFVPLRQAAGEQNSPLPDESVQEQVPVRAKSPAASMPTQILDDRENIRRNNQVMLMVENDIQFANILLNAAREKKFCGIVATRGMEALELAERFDPCAITLDLHLPDIDGWTVLERLKRNPATRHIPVQILSAEDDRARGLRYGAYDYLVKPVTADEIQQSFVKISKFSQRKLKDLLLIAEDKNECENLINLIGIGDVRIKAISKNKDITLALKKKRFDCIVLDLSCAQSSPVQLVDSLLEQPSVSDTPIIVTGMHGRPKQEQVKLRKLFNNGIFKEVQSLERLLDETALFLHRSVSAMPDSQRDMLDRLYQGTASLENKKVLVVDDDIRNIFALASVLERNKMDVICAENGKTAIELLQQHADIDIVLMDIMMPEMDGLETMRQIRRFDQYERLPMIALTAKAMKGDREKCIEAGASDYVSKPVDTEQLLSLMRSWLYR